MTRMVTASGAAREEAPPRDLVARGEN
jgi:hypothetical protein